jgi:hypothetical protein
VGGAWAKVRSVALLGAGAVIVHELRYVLTYGDGAGAALAQQGHSYMPVLEALVVVMLCLALLRFAASLTRAFRGILPTGRAPSFARSWLGSSIALIAIYTLQEGFEGAFAPGHPGGAIGVFGNGGWTALLLSVVVGALIAAVSLLSRRAIEFVAARSAAPRRRRPAAHAAWPLVAVLGARRLDVLAWNLAGRAPPA